MLEIRDNIGIPLSGVLLDPEHAVFDVAQDGQQKQKKLIDQNALYALHGTQAREVHHARDRLRQSFDG